MCRHVLRCSVTRALAILTAVSAMIGIPEAKAQNTTQQSVIEELRRKAQQAQEQARVETLCTQRAYKVSSDPKSAAHQQALAACRAENGQPREGAGATSAAQVPPVAGTYVGTYQCAQGSTRLKVEIDQRNPPLLTALFTFYPTSRIPGTNTDSFSYQLQGRYEASSETRLTPQAWVSPAPPGYSMVGMVGRFDPPTGGFNGRIEGAGCSAFSVSRNPIKVAEFEFAVANRTNAPAPAAPRLPAAQPTAAAPSAGTAPPVPAASSTPSTVAVSKGNQPPEFSSSDVEALHSAARTGQRVTVRGRINRFTRMNMVGGQTEMPGLYFEGERVVAGILGYGFIEQIEKKFGKDGLVGKTVTVTSPASVRPDGQVWLHPYSADDIRLESQAGGAAPPMPAASSPPAVSPAPQATAAPSTIGNTTNSSADKLLEFDSSDVAGLLAVAKPGSANVKVIVRGTIARADADGLYFEGGRVGVAVAGPRDRALLPKLVGKRVTITAGVFPAGMTGPVQVMLMVTNPADIRVD